MFYYDLDVLKEILLLQRNEIDFTNTNYHSRYFKNSQYLFTNSS